MNKDEKVTYLIEYLMKDQAGYAHMQIPSAYLEKRKFLRALMNVRMPIGLSEEFYKIQDELLKEEALERGIVSVDALPTLAEVFPESKLKNKERIVLWQGDITRLSADAIVNAANSQMLGCFIPGHMCIDNVIHSAAGLGLRDECAMIMGMQGYEEPTGKAKITSGYNLPAKHVIHTVGPIVQHTVTKEQEEELRSCYYECMKLAQKEGLESIVFCCISTGEFHFPNERAAQIALETIDEFLEIGSLKKVVINVFKDMDLRIYEELIKGQRTYDYVLFDLDGTLTEPKEGITKAVAHALKYYGIIVEDLDSLCKFIGPPLFDSFKEYYGFSQEKAEEAVEKFREYFSVKGIFENKVYDNVEKMLETLRERGKTIILATSKPEEFAKRILDHFDLTKYFDYIAGATMDESRVKKADVIAYALELAGVDEIEAAIMVGDRKHDVLGAREEGLPCIGVLYGHGDLQEMKECGADYIAETVEDILKFLP